MQAWTRDKAPSRWLSMGLRQNGTSDSTQVLGQREEVSIESIYFQAVRQLNTALQSAVSSLTLEGNSLGALDVLCSHPAGL